MSPIVLTALIAAAVGLWLFLGRRARQAVRRVVPEKERDGVSQMTAALPSSMKMTDKKHTVKMAVLQAELVVSSEAHALECGLRLARHNMTHQAWLAGLTPQERELHRQSAAALEAAAGPATTLSPPARTRSKLLPPERSGDDWIDRQIDEGYQQQIVRRQQVLQLAAGSLRAEPKLVPYLKEALRSLGREDLWAQIS